MNEHVIPQYRRPNQTSFEIQQGATRSDVPAFRENLFETSSPDLSAKITTALLLAAGTGSRLQPLTKAAPKCLTEVNDISILKRLVDNLREQGFKRLIVVIGHLGDQIQEFLQHYANDLQIDYVVNPDYRTTNNLYSLWLARQQVHESFLLVESDLIFDTKLLDDMLYPDRMAISEILPWMNGTTVELDLENKVTAFRSGEYKSLNHVRQYKTVNIYSLSLRSWRKIERRLSRHILDENLGKYYEVAFAEMVGDGTLSFDAVFFDTDLWYEIDTGEDLIEAEKLFLQSHSITTNQSPIALEGECLPVG